MAAWGLFGVGDPRLPPTQNLHFVTKIAVKPAFWPPDGQVGLQTGLLASKTASRRVSWRPRQLSTGLLAPKTALNEAVRSKTAVTTALCAAKPAFCLPCYDDCLDETSVGSTSLQLNYAACRLASSIYIDGVTLVGKYIERYVKIMKIYRNI